MDKTTDTATTGTPLPSAEAEEHRRLSRNLLRFFYPMHYRVGMQLEAIMCQGRISRKQAAILWLLQTRGTREGWVRRREIETRLANWFEISNSNISKLLRELSKPPLHLIDQLESPDSGREKVIRLTEDGRKFVEGMIDASVDYLQHQLEHVTPDELGWGVDFMALAFRGSERGRVGADVDAPPGQVAGAYDRQDRKRDSDAGA